MKIFTKEIIINSSSRVEFIDITENILKVVKESKIDDGICYIFVPHTTAAVIINENADSSVVEDIIKKVQDLIPQYEKYYTHIEGNSDAHIKSSIIGTSINVFVSNNKLKLGTWQGIFFCEFDGPRQRKVWIKIFGE
ncbi:MAG: secondary thiamine-phosphate synthase enzyme YjbQ [Endomicrobiia bacterium]